MEEVKACVQHPSPHPLSRGLNDEECYLGSNPLCHLLCLIWDQVVHCSILEQHELYPQIYLDEPHLCDGSLSILLFSV